MLRNGIRQDHTLRTERRAMRAERERSSCLAAGMTACAACAKVFSLLEGSHALADALWAAPHSP